MKLTFVINDIRTEKVNFTTTRLARRAIERGHEIFWVGLGDFTYDPSGAISAHGSRPRHQVYKTDAELLADVQAADATLERVCLTKMDVILLRSDPAEELVARPWAPNSALLFAQIASKEGVIVLNDPRRLTDASNKTYFQQYPEVIRPRTCITRDPGEIKRFVKEEKGRAVIKPLQGSGGHGVFLVDEGSGQNINQMIEATLRDGYAIVQEYLPRAASGDVRMFTLNGRPLCIDGVYACLRRYSETGDGRSNISAGGSYELVEPDEDALQLAEIAGAKLRSDGMYLAGLDIVGDKMMEINVDTPGCLNMIDDLTGKDFCGTVIEDLERKVRLQREYGGRLRGHELSSL